MSIKPEFIPSHYLELLPAVLRESEGEFLAKFLNIFESMLTLKEQADYSAAELKNLKSLTQILDQVPAYFYTIGSDSAIAEEFVDWLASWTGLILKEGWDRTSKQNAIAQIIPLYRMRGTSLGLEKLLGIYLGGGIRVINVPPCQVGVNMQVQINTAVDLLYFFIVEVTVPSPKPGEEGNSDVKEQMDRLLNNLKSIIDREKPIHTHYIISFKNFPAMQIDVRSKVEIDTLLWSKD